MMFMMMRNICCQVSCLPSLHYPRLHLCMYSVTLHPIAHDDCEKLRLNLISVTNIQVRLSDM